MGTLKIQNVSKEFGGQLVLGDVSLELNTGEIVGFVGANGSGKTTLFRLITGELVPGSGSITASRGLRIGYLAQDPQITPTNTLFDEVATAFDELRRLEHTQHTLSEEMARTPDGPELHAIMAEYDRVHERFLAAGGYAFETRLGEVLGGLGFSTSDYDLPMSALSGGQQCRAALARLLLEDNTFLLLDEPTNHLDIDAVRWLEKFLAGHHGGAVVVSHDRYLLDRVADRIIEIDRCRVTSYSGNYSTYVKTRDVQRLTQARQFRKDQDFITKERAFIAKHMGKQRTAEAKGRLKRLERRLADGDFVTAAPTQSRGLSFSFSEHDDQPRGWVLQAEKLAKAYGDKELFSGLALHLHPGQRFGITGPNGTGKTTLLRILLGEVEADAGVWQFAPKTRLGYFAQADEGLDGENTLLEELCLARPEFTEQQARAQLGRMLFSGDDAFKKVAQLSGGERSRLRLLKLILAEPNVLILDEPTNHLDIPGREVLEDALARFPGAIVAISHDRYFLDRVADRLLVMRRGSHATYAGNYSYYIAQLEERQASSPGRGAGQRPGTKRRRSPSAASTGAPRKKSRYHRCSLEELEAQITTHEQRLTQISAAFGDAAIYQDPGAPARLREELEEVKAELAELHAAWEEKVDGLA